jgi:hypothetical protein
MDVRAFLNVIGQMEVRIVELVAGSFVGGGRLGWAGVIFPPTCFRRSPQNYTPMDHTHGGGLRCSIFLMFREVKGKQAEACST